MKGMLRRLSAWMVKRELEKHELTFCAMCDNLASIHHGTCEYCDYELDMMAKQSYEEAMLG